MLGFAVPSFVSGTSLPKGMEVEKASGTLRGIGWELAVVGSTGSGGSLVGGTFLNLTSPLVTLGTLLSLWAAGS